MLKRWLFNLGARNRHGIHSPFVFQFLDQALYTPRHRSGPRSQRLLGAALAHFAPKRVGVMHPEGEVCRQVASLTLPPYDAYLAETPDPGLADLIRDFALWNPDAFVYVGGLDQSRQARAHWKTLCNLPQVRVCLETFSAGLLFFRPQQAPQHFKIRI